MNKKAVSGVMLTLLSVSVFALALNIKPSQALSQSVKVALVPSASGFSGNGGNLPLSGFPGGFSPTFTNLDPATIRDAANDPIVAGNYDTVVLVQINYIQNWLSNPTFKSRIDDFVFNGGKLIIWDSECQQNQYSSLVFSHPAGDLSFTADTPGPLGSPNGQIWIVENNTLSTNDTASLSYVNTTAISGGWDIGDANVMQTFSPNWYTDMVVRNVHGTTGPVQTYAIYGHGLTIWNGLDMDWMGGTVADDNLGADNLNYIWFLQLKQDWNPPLIESDNSNFRHNRDTCTKHKPDWNGTHRNLHGQRQPYQSLARCHRELHYLLRTQHRA